MKNIIIAVFVLLSVLSGAAGLFLAYALNIANAKSARIDSFSLTRGLGNINDKRADNFFTARQKHQYAQPHAEKDRSHPPVQP